MPGEIGPAAAQQVNEPVGATSSAELSASCPAVCGTSSHLHPVPGPEAALRHVRRGPEKPGARGKVGRVFEAANRRRRPILIHVRADQAYGRGKGWD
jgi:hypothetical protein